MNSQKASNASPERESPQMMAHSTSSCETVFAIPELHTHDITSTGFITAGRVTSSRSSEFHDAEEQAARRALEMARNAINNSQYDPAPWCRALSQLAKIDPAQFRTDTKAIEGRG